MQRLIEEKHHDKQMFEAKRAALKGRLRSKHDQIHRQYEATRELRNPYGERSGERGSPESAKPKSPMSE